jgi:hypothetical protein
VFLLAAGCEHGLHEVAYDMERDALFLLSAPCGEHGAAAGEGSSAHLVEEGGLTEPGRPGEDEPAAVSPWDGPLSSVNRLSSAAVSVSRSSSSRCGRPGRSPM